MKTFLTILLAFTSAAQASVVLVAAPLAPTTEYHAALRAHSDWQSPTDFYRQTHPLQKNREDLVKRFAQAQKVFVAAPQDAVSAFKAVVELEGADDWSLSERETFLFSYLRLAQLETTDGARDEWLNQALTLKDTQLSDSGLIPPPIMARLEQLKAIAPKINITIANRGDAWSEVLINGVSCTQDQCGEWPDVNKKVRVTFLSDRYNSQSQWISLREVNAWKPARLALMEGTCGEPIFTKGASDFVDKHAFWNLACEPSRKKELSLKPVNPATPTNEVVQIPNTDESKPFYKSPWVWTGVGAVVAAMLIISSQHHGGSTETTTTYGFR